MEQGEGGIFMEFMALNSGNNVFCGENHLGVGNHCFKESVNVNLTLFKKLRLIVADVLRRIPILDQNAAYSLWFLSTMQLRWGTLLRPKASCTDKPRVHTSSNNRDMLKVSIGASSIGKHTDST